MLMSTLQGNPASPGALYYGAGGILSGKPVLKYPELSASPRDALPSTLDRQSTSAGGNEVQQYEQNRNGLIALAVVAGFLIYLIRGN